jgi:hypothetical protein
LKAQGEYPPNFHEDRLAAKFSSLIPQRRLNFEQPQRLWSIIEKCKSEIFQLDLE